MGAQTALGWPGGQFFQGVKSGGGAFFSQEGDTLFCTILISIYKGDVND